MENCENCKWDLKGECKQGHVRWNRDKKWIIEDCHAWEEKKEECWWCRDWLAFTKESKGFPIYERMKKLIGLNLSDPECPLCGKKFNEAEKKL